MRSAETLAFSSCEQVIPKPKNTASKRNAAIRWPRIMNAVHAKTNVEITAGHSGISKRLFDVMPTQKQTASHESGFSEGLC